VVARCHKANQIGNELKVKIAEEKNFSAKIVELPFAK
jgi:hypothetical protein